MAAFRFSGCKGSGLGKSGSAQAGGVTELNPAPIPSDFSKQQLHTLKPFPTTIIDGGFRK